jgi:hypothetical protein
MAIDPQLHKVISALAASQKEAAGSALASTRRSWMDFQDIKVVGKFDLEGQHALFDRGFSNDQYAKAVLQQQADADEDGAKVKSVQSTKISADLLGGMERDYKMRVRSRIRMFAHGMNRAAGNNLVSGPLQGNTIGFLTRLEQEEQKDV